MHYIPQNTPAYFIAPKPSIASKEIITVIAETATIGIKNDRFTLTKSNINF